MKLDEYIKAIPSRKRTSTIKKIADYLGVAEPTVRSMINGYRAINAKYAIPLEKITGGKVRCHEICPDIYPKDFFCINCK